MVLINTIDKLLGIWLNAVQRWAWLVIVALLLLSGAAVFYIKGNLGINTNTADMLSEDLDWRQTYIYFKKAFPQLSDTIAIVVEGPTPDQVQDTSDFLAEKLSREAALFTNISRAENSGFFKKNSLLYLDTDALYDLSEDLAAIQPFLARLQSDQTLRGLFSVLQEALSQESEDVDLDPVFSAIDKTMMANLEGQRKQMSWQALMSRNADQHDSNDNPRTILTLNPKLDYSELLPGKPAMESLHKIISEIEDNQVKARLTGSVALAYEELNSVTAGAKTGGIIALFAVTLVLFMGLGSPSLVFATLLTLIIGLIWTAAFATIAIGELNLISVAFMVLYIGLGVDFAIHLCLSFREKCTSMDSQTAVISSASHIGISLFLCSFTTAIGFYAFIPTSYSGVAELGLISGTGMFISLFLTLTLLPALLSILPGSYQQKRPVSSTGKLQNLPITYAKPIAMLSMILGLASIALLQKITFDHNPVHLMDPHSESVQTFKDLLEKSSHSPLYIDVISPAVKDLRKKLSALDSVESVITINSFIPSEQEEKLQIIDELSLVMGSDTEMNQPSATIDDDARLTALKNFNRQLQKRIEDSQMPASAKALYETLNLFLEHQTADLESLERDLLSSLPGRLQRLQDSLSAEEVSLDSLPAVIKNDYISKNQLYRIQVFPKADLDDNVALERFVNDIRRIAPNATGTPVINLEASNAVIKAFQLAFTLALLVISIFLWILLDKKTDVLMVLAPLILAGLLTGAASVIFNIPINFANIIALPLLLGIGVDGAIHILHRYRAGLPEDSGLLATSTAKAVLFSALTTACSFGNLAVSPHQGTASMGILLTIGLVFSVGTILLFLPSLLTITAKKGSLS